MSCHDTCLMMDDYDCGPSFSTESTPRAKKPHQCCECREVIPVGATYERVSGVWDGRFDTFKTCAECVEIRMAFSCGSWVYGYLWESVRESLFPDWDANLFGVECLARLKTDAATAKMRAAYNRYREDQL